MFSYFIHLFKPPTPSLIIKQSLQHHQTELLKHQDLAAYHAKMAEYNAEGIERLGGLVSM